MSIKTEQLDDVVLEAVRSAIAASPAPVRFGVVVRGVAANRAIVANNGDIDKALQRLRKKKMLVYSSKAGWQINLLSAPASTSDPALT